MATESLLTRQELLSCVELGKALTAELGSKQLFNRILRKVSELLPAENWSMLLVDEATGDLRFELSVELDLALVKDVRLRMGEGIAGQVALEQKPIFVEDVRNCRFFSDVVDKMSGFITKSIICVPLVFGPNTLGVIEVVNPKKLSGKAMPLLSIIADYAAVAVENMRRYEHIQYLAIHDDLTGLFNTRYLYDALGGLIASSKVDDDRFSLVFMDIDNFKRVVDVYGHLKGSQAIQEVARTLRGCLTEPSFGVAYGGDEFVYVLPGFDKGLALRKAEETRLRMCETAYLAEHGHNLTLTASFGVATFPDDASDVRGLLALADGAMFDVKEEGKNAVRSA
jgi:diguanylate cyclase (GGDEF)-like protein